MKLWGIAKRFLTPPIIVTLIYWRRAGAKVSLRAEVDLTTNLKFGQDCVVSSFSKIKATAGQMHLGNRVQVATHCFLSADAGGVSIGDDAMIGPLASIIGNNYSYERLDQPVSLQRKTSKGIRIGNGVWIGAGAVILDGADIGDNVIVSPNSVVSGRVQENVIVQGNPARVIFTRR